MAYRQLYLDTLRGGNARSSTVDPNAPIPLPGQPTNTHINPSFGSAFPNSSYVNQDTDAFNAPQTIPLPGQPTPYGMTQAQPLPGGTPMNLNGGPPNGGWGDTARLRERWSGLIGGLLAQQQPPGIPQAAPQAPLGQQQQQASFAPAGMYGRQAMQMAGMRGPDSYPNGLLGGGKGPFRPGGK